MLPARRRSDNRDTQHRSLPILGAHVFLLGGGFRSCFWQRGKWQRGKWQAASHWRRYRRRTVQGGARLGLEFVLCLPISPDDCFPKQAKRPTGGGRPMPRDAQPCNYFSFLRSLHKGKNSTTNSCH